MNRPLIKSPAGGVHPRQSQSINSQSGRMPLTSFTATVAKAHSDRSTCDLLIGNQVTLRNIPVLTRVGNTEGKLYGTIDLPQKGDKVIVLHIEGPHEMMFIIGSIIPFLRNEYQSSQEPVNSTDKTHTDKLLEADKPKTFKRIFPSGTSVEVQEDGTTIVETPSGALVHLDESAKVVTVSDSHGNQYRMNSEGFSISNSAQDFKQLLDTLLDELIAFRTFGSPSRHQTDPTTVTNLQQLKSDFAALWTEG